MLHQQQVTFKRPPTNVVVRTGASRTESVSGAVARPTEEEQRQNREQQLIAQNKALQETLDALQDTLVEHEQRRQDSLLELQQIAVELAVMAASHVVHAELDRETLGVENMVGNIIDQIGVLQTAVVRLHPSDLQSLQAALKNRSPSWDEQLIKLLPDTNVSRGGARLETESGRIVVSDVVTRLEHIRDEWMENIDDTQTERRELSQNAGSMRRFPDRRETA